MDSRSRSIKAALSRLKKQSVSIEDLWQRILLKDKVAIGQAISILESQASHHQELAEQLIQRCIDSTSQKSHKIGITGVPGVGKSTFINAYTQLLVDKGHSVAILAVDPSSQQSKGSILGDKTRMSDIFSHPRVLIRPSPSGQQLGGVAHKTREVILLCEAAGFDKILVETVGVGQSETAVHQMTDIFILLMLSGAGDELQGIKRGIMEMADLLIVHKADGDNIIRAKTAATEYKRALHFFPAHESHWTPSVLTASSVTNEGLEHVHEKIESYFNTVISNGYLAEKRSKQWTQWFEDSLEHLWLDIIQKHPVLSQKFQLLSQEVRLQNISPLKAAHQLIDSFLSNASR